MAAPHLPWEHEFDWHEHQHPGSVFDIDDPAAPWHGAYEQGAGLGDQALERLVHAVVAPGAGYDQPGQPGLTTDQRMADVESSQRDVNSVIADIKAAQNAYNQVSSAARETRSKMQPFLKGLSNTDESFHVDWRAAAAPVAWAGLNAGALGALEAAPEVAAVLGMEYAGYVTRREYDAQPGTAGEKGVNLLQQELDKIIPPPPGTREQLGTGSRNRHVAEAERAVQYVESGIAGAYDAGKSAVNWVTRHLPGHH